MTPVTYQWLSMDIAHSIAIKKPFQWLGFVLRGTPNDFRLADPIPRSPCWPREPECWSGRQAQSSQHRRGDRLR